MPELPKGIREWINNFKVPYATMAIILFSFVIYFLNSGGNPYVYPVTKLAIYGVSDVNRFVGGLLFSFTHIGLKHLMANMFVLAILGTILEQRLKSWHVFVIFLFSGWIAGVVYTTIKPDVWVLGASAAICGLIGAGLIVDFKRTILGAVFAISMVPVVVYPTADWVIITFYTHQEETIQENVQKIVQYQEQLKNATPEEKPKIIQKINQTYHQTKMAVQKVEKLEKGVKKEAETPAASLIHVLGGILGATLAILLDRRSLEYLKRDMDEIFRVGKS